MRDQETELSPATLLPSWGELRAGLHDTQLLVRLRWRLVRSRWSRLGMVLSLLVLGAMTLLVANTGSLLRILAEDGRSTAASSFAVDYVIALDRGEISGLASSTLGAVVLVSLLAPFSGSSMHALADVEDLTGIRPSRMHRYFDSVITAAVSSIGALQLVALTAVASLLVLDGDRTDALVMAWTTWPALVLLTTAQGWFLELAHRSLGRATRRSLALLVPPVLVAALWLDPQHGMTLFGVGEALASVLRAAGQGDWPQVVVGCSVVALLLLGLTAAGLVCCRAALARPEAGGPGLRRFRIIVPMSGRPTVSMLQMLLAHVWRTPQVRRPIVTMAAVGLPVYVLAGDGSTGMTVIVVTAPLSVALAFGVNIFGVLGPGMVWLAAQPHVMRRLLALTMTFQVAVTFALGAAIWAPAVLVVGTDLDGAAALAGGMVVSTAFTTASSAASAVRDPHEARLGGRDDMIVPPAIAVLHTLRISLVAGLLGVLTLHADGVLRLALVAAALTWAALRTGALLAEWRDPAVRAFVIFRVAT